MLAYARLRNAGSKAATFAVIAGFATFAAFPFAWMLITSFKETTDLLDPTHNPFVFHKPPTLEHLRVLFFETQFTRFALNTLFVGGMVVLITLVLAIPAGYSLAPPPFSSSRCLASSALWASRIRFGPWCSFTRALPCRSPLGC